MAGTEQDTSRGTKWFMLLAFSIISLVALTTDVGTVSSEPKYVKWSVSAVSISLALSALAVIAGALLKTKFVGTAIEGGLSLIVLIFWAAVMPALMLPENNLAINSLSKGVGNANLYFFSWASLITSVLVFVHYLRTVYKIGEGNNVDFNVALWAGLCIASFVVMTSSTRIYQDVHDECDLYGASYCKRTKFAVALGVISAALSLLWIVLGAVVPVMIDTLMCVLLMIAWIFGIIFITFGGESAPGAFIGNLYFSTWFSFVISVVLGATGIRRMLHKDEETTTEVATEGAAAPDEEQGKEEKAALEEEIKA